MELSKERYLDDWLTVSPLVLYVLRLEGEAVAGRWVSPAVERVTGYSAAEALEDGWWDRNLHPEDREEAFQSIARVRAKGHHVQEFRFRHAEGRWVWIRDELRLSDRNPDEVVGSWSDITPIRNAQRSAERAVLEGIRRLEESEQRYRSLLENNPNPVYAFDREGRFTAVNAATTDITGRSATDLLQLSFPDIIHPHDLPLMWAAFDEAWTGRPEEYELRVVRPDGDIRHIRGITAPTVVRGEIVGVYGVASDETNRIEERRRREELEERLHQSQKMEAVGRLAGGVAHDFNNLLTGLRGLVGLRLEEMAADHPFRSDLEEVDRIAERGSALVRQLLVFSRNQVTRTLPVDLNALVRETDRMLRRIVGEDIRFETELDPGETGVRADPAQLQQVILNLVLNARHAMPDGGRLWVRTRCEAGLLDADGRARDTVVLEVEDTGLGIPDDIVEHVFDPFFTTKGPGEGTGLGLSTVYGVVRQSDGDVTVDSAVGRGTTFRVILPRAPLASEPPDPPVTAGTDGVSAGTVLIVEDERTVRQLVSRILQRKGFRVIEAVSGQEALGWLDEAQPLDLVISDVIMPGMSGPELVGRLRQNRPDTPVLMISGYDEDRLVSLPAGRTAFLAKPFTPAELTGRISRLLGCACQPDATDEDETVG